jgi:uncharacterized protein (DUF1015 family)
MAVVRPFRALRPTSESAGRVAAVPYDVVTADEARELASGNPLNFLHVSRAEIDLPPGTDPYSPEVYAKAAENFRHIKEAAPLILEEEPSLYFYRLAAGDHSQTGLAGAFSLDDYDRDVTRKHERTRRDKEDDRTRHIVTLRAQTGPVFLTYRTRPSLKAIATRACEAAPLFDFEAVDGVRHTAWQVTGIEARTVVDEIAQLDALYIADGHHRAASAARARGELRAAGAGSVGDTSAADYFLAVAFPHDQVRILPYHRVVKDLGGRTPEAFVAAVRERFPIRESDAAQQRKGDVSMYVAGRWYVVEVGQRAEGKTDRISRLDVAVLQEELLEQILGIGDVRTDKRIDFVGGLRGPAELVRLVDSGRAAVAFSMYPVTVEDLMGVSDEGGIMPPKSTWFEPKLRDGLLIHGI